MVVSMVEKLAIAREHYASCDWREKNRKVDLTIRDPNLHNLFLTSFGVMLDLMGAEKDNNTLTTIPLLDFHCCA